MTVFAQKMMPSIARHFRPGLLPTLAVLLLLPLLLALGFWQLSRAEEKRQLLADYQAIQQAPPISLGELFAQTVPKDGQRVQLQGRFDAAHSLLLDNRTRSGRAGVELLQPFQDKNSGLWLLVNRGWLPWPDRRVAPTFATPDNEQQLIARVYLPKKALFQLESPDSDDWPRLISAVQAQTLWQQLKRDGLPWQLRLEDSAAAYITDWQVVSMPPAKHTGYAVQWFALAATLAALYLYLGRHHARKNRSA